ncbi:MAG: hypothetical protein ACOZAJ_01795 [Patescibacteria group bacterium]
MGYRALINNIFGNSLNVEHLPAGFYNSDVAIISKETRKVVKIFSGRPGMPLTPESAVISGKRISEYRNRLAKMGMEVSSFFNWVIAIDEETGLPSVVMIEPYCGPDVATLLRQADDDGCLQLERGLLGTLEPIIKSGLSGRLSVGIDAQPSNFTWLDGRYTFIDFTPPRYLEGENYLIEDPQPKTKEGYDLGFWRYYTPEGILSVFLSQLTRIRPKMFSRFKDLLVSWLNDNDVSLAQQFKNLSINLDNLNSIINPVQLRLIMCDLISRNGASIEEVGGFFKLTHFEDQLSDITLAAAHKKIRELYYKVTN